jgi:hypothetical protein
MLARRLATYEDLLALPEGTRAELLAGELVTQPGPVSDHRFAQSGLDHFIGGPFQFGRGGSDGWWILVEMDVRSTPHDVTCPDLSGWRRARLPSPRGMRPIEVVPDWTCEVLSPSNARRDRTYKADLYASRGVGHFWIVDPVERVLEAYALEAGRWSRLGAYDETATVRIPPFAAVELDVGRLFFPLEAAVR